MITTSTYKSKQYWITALLSGVLLSALLTIVYVVFYERLYVESSFLFSIIYLIPLVWLSATLAIFRSKFATSGLSYGQAFLMSFTSGITASLLFSMAIYVAYAYIGLESRIVFYDNAERFQDLFSPQATALSFLIINVALTLVFSLIISIFIRKN